MQPLHLALASACGLLVLLTGLAAQTHQPELQGWGCGVLLGLLALYLWTHSRSTP
jgi:hypothetical protein